MARIPVVKLCEYDTTRARHGRRMMASERVRAKGGLGLSVDTLNPFWGGLFLGILHSWNACALCLQVGVMPQRQMGEMHVSLHTQFAEKIPFGVTGSTLSMGLLLLPNPTGRGPVQSSLVWRAVVYPVPVPPPRLPPTAHVNSYIPYLT